MNKTVIEIIKKNLIEDGFGGLYNEDLGCGCEIDDLEPCGEIRSDCKAGYKHQGDKECDFFIKDHKHDNNSN